MATSTLAKQMEDGLQICEDGTGPKRPQVLTGPDEDLPIDTPCIRLLKKVNLKEDILYLCSMASKAKMNAKPLDPTLEKKQKLCHILGSFLSMQWKEGNEGWIHRHAAHVCRLENKRLWKKVSDVYEDVYDSSGPATWQTNRWPKDGRFDHEKVPFVLFLKNYCKHKISLENFGIGLYSFRAVRYYLYDLMWQQYAKRLVAIVLFPDQWELHTVMDEQDKIDWDAVMVAASVLKNIFGERTLVFEDKFVYKDFDCFNYSTIEQGKEYLQKRNRKVATEKDTMNLENDSDSYDSDKE